MFVKLVLFVLVLHLREMKFHDDFVEDQMEENSQLWNVTRPFRRRMSQLSACSAKPQQCVGTCFYEFIDRGCYDAEVPIPSENIAGLGKNDTDSIKYPFMLSLRYPREDSDGAVVPNCFTHFCGAVLLWQDIAITAAHCLVNDQRPLLTDDQPFSKFNSKITVSRFSQCRHQDGSEELFAQEAIVHPEYNKRNFNNDIAIIRLRGEMSTDHGFIKLYTSKNDENIFDAQILGFGATVLDKEFSKESVNLQLATVQTMMFEVCKKYFESIDEPLSVDKLNSTTMLCSRAFDADTCEGDSGGPLFLKESDGQVYLLGIASWGSARQCDVMNFGQPPSVFARINFYKDWIVQTINQLTVYPPYQNLQDNQGISSGSTTVPSALPPQSGTLVENITDFKELQELLGLGQIGTLPKEISILTNLEKLFFFADFITGTIPRELSVLTNLVDMSLSANSLTGTIPRELSVLTNLVVLSLSINRLTGTIPSQLSALTSLQRLILEGNRLTGTIPKELSALTKLEYFSLENMYLKKTNNFIGTLPGEFSVLTSANIRFD